MTASPPLLVVDVGNSRVKFGIFREWLPAIPGTLPNCDYRVVVEASDEPFPWSELDAALGEIAPLSLVAAVNPPILERLLDNWPRSKWPEPQFLANSAALPIINQTLYPDRVGTDRLLKAVAGNVLRPTDQPLILVDSGTATTVDWVTSEGAFAGGAILPGLGLSARALHEYTAQLPWIAPESFLQAAPAVIGTQTRAALQSGIYWGHVGAVRELLQRMTAEHPGATPTVLISGGAGEIVARELGWPGSYHRDLTLQGLAITARSRLWPL